MKLEVTEVGHFLRFYWKSLSLWHPKFLHRCNKPCCWRETWAVQTIPLFFLITLSSHFKQGVPRCTSYLISKQTATAGLPTCICFPKSRIVPHSRPRTFRKWHSKEYFRRWKTLGTRGLTLTFISGQIPRSTCSGKTLWLKISSECCLEIRTAGTWNSGKII
jgi:hypothetical protein